MENQNYLMRGTGTATAATFLPSRMPDTKADASPASLSEDDIEEAKWQATFAATEDMLIGMAKEAWAEYNAGMTTPLGRDTD